MSASNTNIRRHVVETSPALMNYASILHKYWSPYYNMLKTFGRSCYPQLRLYSWNKHQPRSTKFNFLGQGRVHKSIHVHILFLKNFIFLNVLCLISMFFFLQSHLLKDLPNQVMPHRQPYFLTLPQSSQNFSFHERNQTYGAPHWCTAKPGHQALQSPPPPPTSPQLDKLDKTHFKHFNPRHVVLSTYATYSGLLSSQYFNSNTNTF